MNTRHGAAAMKRPGSDRSQSRKHSKTERKLTFNIYSSEEHVQTKVRNRALIWEAGRVKDFFVVFICLCLVLFSSGLVV